MVINSATNFLEFLFYIFVSNNPKNMSSSHGSCIIYSCILTPKHTQFLSKTPVSKTCYYQFYLTNKVCMSPWTGANRVEIK
jgi:hypothetical protein